MSQRLLETGSAALLEAQLVDEAVSQPDVSDLGRPRRVRARDLLVLGPTGIAPQIVVAFGILADLFEEYGRYACNQ